MSQQISVRFDEDSKQQLDRIAKLSGRPVAQIIRQCVVDHMEDMEDLYTSLRRLEKGEKSWALSDVKKEILDS